MKKILTIVVAIFASALICNAQSLKIGAHVGYTMGGDVEEEDVAYGAQVGLQLNDILGLELSGTTFEDNPDQGMSARFYTIGLTGLLGTEIVDKVRIYGGVGVNYNLVDVDDDLEGIDVDMDNKVGYHFCGGLQLELAKNLELFGEYRYTILEVEGDVYADGERENLKDDYNFGVAKVGVNFLF